MLECNFVNFDITIQDHSAPYPLLARYGEATASGRFAAQITDAHWRSVQRELERSTQTPDADAIVAAGSALFQLLFQGDLRDLWVAARSDLEQEHIRGLRLRLDLQPAAVAALPWEALYDPDRNLPFAASSQVSLVRVASLYRHVGAVRRLRVALPLRVLIAAPEDANGTLDIVQEIANTQQLLGSLGADVIQLATPLTGRFNITDLRRRLTSVKPTIFHFIGHGAPEGLWMWHRNQPILVSTASLRSVMEGATSVKLALINSCLAARQPGQRLFTTVAEQMLQAGVPAVIAMQFPIRDDTAIDFAHFLYEELLCGACPGHIDLAVAAARAGLYMLNPGDFSYGTPILWLNRPNGQIFQPAIDEEKRANSESEAAAPAPPVAPSIDLAAEDTWLAEITTLVDLNSLPADYYFLRSKWQNILEELESILYQLHALAHAPMSAVFATKVAEYRRYKAAALRLKRFVEEASRTS